jgi:hypothetical protein
VALTYARFGSLHNRDETRIGLTVERGWASRRIGFGSQRSDMNRMALSSQ